MSEKIYICIPIRSEMKKSFIILLFTLFLNAHGFAQWANANVDSLKNVADNSSGLDKMEACVALTINIYIDSNDEALEYAIKGVAEGEELLASKNYQDHDAFFHLLTSCYAMASMAYYNSVRGTNDQEKIKYHVEKQLYYNGKSDWAFQQIKNLNKIKEANPRFLIELYQARLFSYMAQGNIDSVLITLDNVIDYAKSQNIVKTVTSSVIQKANVMAMMGETDAACASISNMIDSLESFDIDTVYALQLRIVGYENIAAILVNAKRYDEGKEYIDKALDLVKGYSNHKVYQYCYDGLREIYEAKGDYKRAYEYTMLAKTYEDSLFNQQKMEQISELEVKYNTQEKQFAIDKLENQRMAIMIAVFVLIVVLAMLVYIAVQRRRHNATLKAKNLQIEQQRDGLNSMLLELSSSISYASLIQNQIMLGDRKVTDVIENGFVIYSPKDVVGGDFFYAKQYDEYKIIAVADCTGHGVSAALLTVMSIALLNEYFAACKAHIDDVDETGFARCFDPAAILERLRQDVKTTLNVKTDEGVALSGMDMALIVHKKGSTKISFTGANRPLTIVRADKQIVEIRPVRNPVAQYINERKFVSEEFEFEESDMFYMYSDGITDQFSADGKYKFCNRRLKEMFTKYASEEVQEQKRKMLLDFNVFRGSTPQVDDALLVGFRGTSL